MPLPEKKSRRDLKQLSDTELKRLLELAADGTTGRKLATEELARRHLKSVSKPYGSIPLRTSVIIIVIFIIVIGAFLLLRRRI